MSETRPSRWSSSSLLDHRRTMEKFPWDIDHPIQVKRNSISPCRSDFIANIGDVNVREGASSASACLIERSSSEISIRTALELSWSIDSPLVNDDDVFIVLSFSPSFARMRCETCERSLVPPSKHKWMSSCSEEEEEEEEKRCRCQASIVLVADWCDVATQYSADKHLFYTECRLQPIAFDLQRQNESITTRRLLVDADLIIEHFSFSSSLETRQSKWYVVRR